MSDDTIRHLEARIESLERTIEQQQEVVERLDERNERQEEMIQRLRDAPDASSEASDILEEDSSAYDETSEPGGGSEESERATGSTGSEGADESTGGVPRPGRRQVLQAVGLAGLVGLGATTAAGQPQGRIGTESRPLERLFTESIAGGLTGGEAVDNLVGAGLDLSERELTAHGSWNQIDGLVAEEQLLEPREDAVDGIHVDLVRTEEEAMDISVGLDLYDNPTEVARFEGGGGSPPRISFGRNNTLGSGWGNVSGGTGNTIDGAGSSIGGGASNEATENFSTVAGGRNNEASGVISTVSGGERNVASGRSAVIGGGGGKHEPGDPEWLENVASGHAATVGGGLANEAIGDFATISGGAPADVEALESVENNIVHDRYGTVGGGGNNSAGNSSDSIDAEFATVSGGEANVASGQHATIPGGYNNEAAGDRSFAAGRNASANHDGSFVFGDSTGTPAQSQQANEARFQMPVHPEQGITFEPSEGDTEQLTAGPVANGVVTWNGLEWSGNNTVNVDNVGGTTQDEVTIDLPEGTGNWAELLPIVTGRGDPGSYPRPIKTVVDTDQFSAIQQHNESHTEFDSLNFVVYRLPDYPLE